MADHDDVGELEKRLAGELRWDEKTCEAAVELAKTQRRFDLAWRVLDRTDLSAASPLRDWRWQQYALCKSQDHDIPTDERHREALNDLERELSLSKTTDDHETLGIAGGICKRWWREDGQRVHLHRAFAYYYRGYKAAGSDDLGYNGINAAFLLDLFALEELDAGMPVSSPLVKDRLDLADEMRTAIAAMPLTKPYTRWWPYVTIAEAELGLGRIQHARAVLELATAHGILPSDLQKEVALRQLPVVARNHALRIGNAQYQHDAEAMLSEVLGVPPAAVRNATVGKVGLALSGGGFRASLFHIGVLARLAEASTPM